MRKRVLLGCLVVMTFFTACGQAGVEQTPPLPPSSETTASDVEKSEWGSSSEGTEPFEIIQEDASMDFSNLLGFKIKQWIGVAPVETKVIDEKIAEIKLQMDMDNVGYLRIAHRDAKEIIPTLEGYFALTDSEDIDGISVQLGYTIQGPMIASWEKDGYLFCFYQKKGEASLAQESFASWVSYYVKDILLSSG